MSPCAQSNSKCVESATVMEMWSPPQAPVSARDGLETLPHAHAVASATMSVHFDHRDGMDTLSAVLSPAATVIAGGGSGRYFFPWNVKSCV